MNAVNKPSFPIDLQASYHDIFQHIFTLKLINTPTNILTVAGSDSSGAAGIQADLRTLQSLGVHGCPVITAITAQGSDAFTSQAVELELFRQQLEMLFDDFEIAAVKTGMLATPVQVECLAKTLPEDTPLIIDPVLRTSSGQPLIDSDTLAAIWQWLLPQAWLVTPNLSELLPLAGVQPTSDSSKDAVNTILDTGCKAVLVKGGHAESDQLCDVLYQYDSDKVLQKHEYQHARQPGEYRGTGCVLSAAIATFIAQSKAADSDNLQHACKSAIDYLQACIRLTPTPAKGEAAILRHPLPVIDR